MAVCLNVIARTREIVPVQSIVRDGVDGWLFRQRDNSLIFVSSEEVRKAVPDGFSTD